MKSCVVNLSNRAYLPGSEVLFYSIKKFNDIETVYLSYECKECLYADRIINFDKTIFDPLRKLPTKERLKYAWDKLIIFKLFKEYDRIIFLDSDMLCLGDISELLSEDLNQYDFAAIKLYNAKGEFIYGGGTMILNKSILNDETYNLLYDISLNYHKYGIYEVTDATKSDLIMNVIIDLSFTMPLNGLIIYKQIYKYQLEEKESTIIIAEETLKYELANIKVGKRKGESKIILNSWN